MTCNRLNLQLQEKLENSFVDVVGHLTISNLEKTTQRNKEKEKQQRKNENVNPQQQKEINHNNKIKDRRNKGLLNRLKGKTGQNKIITGTGHRNRRKRIINYSFLALVKLS